MVMKSEPHMCSRKRHVVTILKQAGVVQYICSYVIFSCYIAHALLLFRATCPSFLYFVFYLLGTFYLFVPVLFIHPFQILTTSCCLFSFPCLKMFAFLVMWWGRFKSFLLLFPDKIGVSWIDSIYDINCAKLSNQSNLITVH